MPDILVLDLRVLALHNFDLLIFDLSVFGLCVSGLCVFDFLIFDLLVFDLLFLDLPRNSSRSTSLNHPLSNLTMVPFKREEGSQQPELPPAVDVIESKGGFGDCDLALFRTGAHADVRVICEDRQFDVHKAVLASRSAWFEQTLARMEQVGSSHTSSKTLLHKEEY